MKILFAAPFTYNNLTFFISNFFEGLAKSAKQLGHEVRMVQTSDTLFPFSHTFQKEFNILNYCTNNIAFIPNDKYMGEALLQEVKQFEPDILFLHIINSYDLSKYLQSIRKQGTIVLSWLGVHPSVVANGIHKILKNSDHTLIYDKNYVDYYRNVLNIKNTLNMSLGCDVDYFDKITPDKKFMESNSSDVSFIGMFDSHRESYLNSLTEYRLGIWSWNINSYQTGLSRFCKGVTYGENLVKILKSSKISLNIHRKYEISGGNYRLFEIPASRTFQLVDEKQDIKNFFEIGKEIVTFKDKNDLRNKAEYYLRNEDERKEIAQAGYERVKKEHNLNNRLTTLLNLLNI